jgi:hypothetical protein
MASRHACSALLLIQQPMIRDHGKACFSAPELLELQLCNCAVVSCMHLCSLVQTCDGQFPNELLSGVVRSPADNTRMAIGMCITAR